MIRRYDGPLLEAEPNGAFVAYDDHLAEIEALKAEIEKRDRIIEQAVQCATLRLDVTGRILGTQWRDLGNGSSYPALYAYLKAKQDQKEEKEK